MQEGGTDDNSTGGEADGGKGARRVLILVDFSLLFFSKLTFRMSL